MRVTLFMAMSVNGMVARKNGDEDFISDKSWKVFVGLVAEYGCFVIGRKTLEQVGKWGKKYDLAKLPGLCVVVSKHGGRESNKRVYASSPAAARRKMDKLGFKRVLLAGGPTLNSSFAKAGYINEVIFCVEPALVGEGKSVFYPKKFDLPLTLRSVSRIKGLMVLKYGARKYHV